MGWQGDIYEKCLNVRSIRPVERIFSPTSLRYYPRLSSQLGVHLWVKHDDEYPSAGGGSKVRKLEAILKEADEVGSNAIVTAGAASSNHVRAAALMSAALNWRSHIFIHEPEPAKWPLNLRLASFAGAKLFFCRRASLADAMQSEMTKLQDSGLRPYYVWGGGHTPAGGRAFRDAAFELAAQFEKTDCSPDFIVVGSGTGTTQAGLIAGASKALPKTEVIGISVAHEEPAGILRVGEALRMIGADGSKNPNFYAAFLAGGYGKSDSEQAVTIQWAAKTEGLLLDPTYTGKAFHGMHQLIKSGRIEKGSTVLFWHTGGLINLLSSMLGPVTNNR